MLGLWLHNILKNNSQQRLFAAAVLTLFSVFAAPSLASSIGNSEGLESQNQGQDVESVSVVGRYPLAYFNRNLVRKEDAFFKLMNALVTDDDFKVDCKTRRTQAFSNLKMRRCEAAFVSRITGELTQARFDLMSLSKRLRSTTNGYSVGSSLGTEQKIKKMQKEQLELMVELINSNEELLKAFNELELAKHQLAMKRAQQ